MDIACLAEHLNLLSSYGTSILESLSRTKLMSYMPSKSSPTTESSLYFYKNPSLLSVAQSLAKKFPELDSVNKQTKEFKEFIDSFKQLKEELRPLYNVFTVWADFVEQSLHTLKSCTQLVTLDMEINPDIAYPFMLLTHQLLASFHLVSKMKKSKKAIVSAIAIIDSRSGVFQDSQFLKLSSLFTLSDDPYPELIRLVNPFSEPLLKMIVSLKPKLESITFASASSLRSSPVLEVLDSRTLDLNSISIPTLPPHYFGQSSLLSSCIISLLLSRPQSLFMDPNLSQFCKLVQTNGTFAHITFFETFHPHPEFEGTMKASNKFSKLKNLICENSTKQKHLHLQFHDDRRQFFIERLSQLFFLCQDQPKMLAPNLFTILTCLMLARDEVLWHLMHPEDDRKSAQKTFFKSLELLHLIYLICEWEPLLLKFSKEVQTFFLSMIKSEWNESFDQACTAMNSLPELPINISAVLQDMRTAYQEFSLSNLSLFQRFRLDWARLQVYFSSPEAVLPISSMSHITATMNKLCVLSTYIDGYDQHLDQVTDLSFILNYKDIWFSMVLETISKVKGLRFVSSVPIILQSFSKVGLDVKGAKSDTLIMEMLDRFFSSLSEVIGSSLQDLVERKIEVDRNTVTLHERTSPSAMTSVKSDEMYCKAPDVLEALDTLRFCIFECLSIFQLYPTIEFSNFVFHPLKCLETHLTSVLQAFLQNFVFDFGVMNSKDPPLIVDAPYIIWKPTLLLRDLQTMMEEYLKMHWFFPNFSFITILETVMRQQNDIQNINNAQETIPDFIPNRAMPSKKRALKAPVSKPPYSVSLSNYYVEVFTYRAIFNMFLINSHMLTMRSDSDCYELSALMTLLGPNGLYFLDTRLLRNIGALGSFFINQFQPYASLLNHALDPSTSFLTYLPKLKNIEEVFQKTTSFGILCELRSLYYKLFLRNFRHKSLLRLLSACQRKSMSVAPDSIQEDALCHQLNAKLQFLGVEQCIENHLAQSSDFIKTLQPTQDTFSALTGFFALLLCFVSTRDSYKYLPYANGNALNAHCLATAIHLILTVSVTKFHECNKKQCQFLEETTFSIASSWLLQLLTPKFISKDTNTAQFYESCFMLLQKLASLAGKLGSEWMECYVGTCVFQTLHSSILRKRKHVLPRSNSENVMGKPLSEVAD